MSYAMAVATLMSEFPDLKVVEVIHHARSTMTDAMPETEPSEQDGPGGPLPTFPEHHPNPHNHRFTVSFDPSKPPFVVVRAQSADELKDAFAELESSGAYAAMGAAYDTLKRQGAVGAGIGAPHSVAPPQGPPAPPQGPGAPANFANPNGNFSVPQGATPPPFGPNVSVPQVPGYAGPPVPQAPAAPQWNGAPQGGAPARNGPKPRPMDWPQVYKIDVPFNAKEQFKAFREQYKDAFKGKVSWAGGGGYWIHGDIVQSFANYNPVPA